MNTQSSVSDRYFHWQASPDAPGISFDRAALRDLENHVLGAYVPRAEETGGLLLGIRDTDTGAFVIESSKPLPLPWADATAEWRASLPPEFLGIYRTQHSPGLAVSGGDCVMVEKLLPRRDGVLLLVKPLSPAECVGAFFLCDGGAIVDEAASHREFPLGGATVPGPRTSRSRLMKTLLPLTAVAAGIGLASFIHYHRAADPAENPVAVAPAAPPITAPDSPPSAAPRPPINSSSASPKPAPAPPVDASAATGERKESAPRLRRDRPRPLLARRRAPGRVKRMFGGITSKASHLWPFHSGKPD